MNYHEVADLIERFLDKKPQYPQEWNDFLETSQDFWPIEVYRKCCYELDPIVNCPDEPDPIAVAILRSMITALRAADISQMTMKVGRTTESRPFFKLSILVIFFVFAVTIFDYNGVSPDFVVTIALLLIMLLLAVSGLIVCKKKKPVNEAS